jgi:hypothetical protein
VKNDRTVPRKCAACQGEHEAWNGQCPTRKQELAKVKAAYKTRPRYHPENPTPLVPTSRTQNQLRETTTTRTGRPTLAPSQSQGARPSRSKSPTKKLQKRTNPASSQTNDENADSINVATENIRPKRTIIRSRRALEALDVNTQLTNDSHQMDVDNNEG